MPPQRSFPVVSGTFDCPEATDLPTPSNVPTRRPSIHRHFNPYAAQPRIVDLHHRVQSMNNGARGSVTPDNGPQAPWLRPTSRSPANAVVTNYLQRHRLRRQREDDTLGTVQEAVDRLNEATSDLSSILDEPLPQIITSDEHEHVASLLADPSSYFGRRNKRRKLDGDPIDHGPAPNYGHKGQVVPGRLKMSLASCDGGQLPQRDDDIIHRQHWPENILSNDKSVYCTEKDQCNIVLRHWRETPFTVTKIVIKTPETGFTAPVQEGLVFVSMTSESLLARTEKYRIRNSPPPRPSDAGTVYTESRGQHARASGPYIRQSSRSAWSQRPHLSLSDARPPSRRQNFSPTFDAASNDIADDLSGDEFEPFSSVPEPMYNATHAMPHDLSVSTGYHVTTDCGEPSDDEEDPSSGPVLDDLQRRRFYGPDATSSDEEVEVPTRRSRRLRNSPRKIEIDSDPPSYGEPGVEPEVLVPHARFFIERRRNVVSIKFEPPISGRYVLVKLWSPQDHDNIDIQNISVYGFAGPRFVPAIKLK